MLLRESRQPSRQIISAAAYGSRLSPGRQRWLRPHHACALIPAARSARVLQSCWHSSNRGRRESRALDAPAAPCAKVVKEAHGFDRYSRDIPAFPAQWFYGLYVLSPGKRPFLPPLPAENFRQCSARVAAPGPHDFAVRCERFRPVKDHLTPQRPIATRTTFRDDRANVPHGGAGWIETSSDLRNSQGIFCNSEMSPRHSGASAARARNP